MSWQYGEEDGCIFVRQVPDEGGLSRAEMWEELQALRSFKIEIGQRLVEIERYMSPNRMMLGENTLKQVRYFVGSMLNDYFNPCPKNKRRKNED